MKQHPPSVRLCEWVKNKVLACPGSFSSISLPFLSHMCLTVWVILFDCTYTQTDTRSTKSCIGREKGVTEPGWVNNNLIFPLLLVIDQRTDHPAYQHRHVLVVFTFSRSRNTQLILTIRIGSCRKEQQMKWKRGESGWNPII
jgi:hypothetical protein